MTKKTNILELNNLDIYGKRFNGYSLVKYINSHQKNNLRVSLLVNHKFSRDNHVFSLFGTNHALESADWKIDELENAIGTKNQISLSYSAILKHPAYLNADILHFHMYHNMHLPIEFLAQIPLEKKIILEMHDIFWLSDNNNIPILEVFDRSSLNNSSLCAQKKRILKSIDAELIVHSPYMLNLFKKSNNTKGLHAHLINFGVNLKIFKPLKNIQLLRKKYGIHQNDIVILFRAQKEFKGINYIINAMQKLKSDQNIILLTVGGETGLLNSLSSKYRIIEMGLIGSEKKMAELFNISDIFLAPSTEESFGFMAVEAMACAKPVIVFDGTALPNTVNAPTIGISVPKNSASLAKAIEDLIKNPSERLKRGAKGLDFAIKNYDEQQYFKENIALYEQLKTKKKRSTNKTRSSNKTSSNTVFAKHAETIQNFLLEKPSQLKPFILDYNDQIIQKEILAFDQKLYYNITRSSKITPKKIIQKILPKSIKKILKKVNKK